MQSVPGGLPGFVHHVYSPLYKGIIARKLSKGGKISVLCSMTGFARVEDTCEQGSLSWELRSVNHRYLEVGFRLPDEVRGLEPQFRSYLQARLARGKVDCVFRCQLEEQHASDLKVNEPLLESLLRQIAYVNDKLPQHAPAKAIDVLAWPGLVQAVQADTENFHAACYELFTGAADQLVEMRATEGRRIEKMLQERCAAIDVIVKKIRSRHDQVLIALRGKVQQRLEELSVEIDQNRLEQELVYLAQKLDIAEELDRLESHISEMANIFSRKEPTGRRLDFLMQEFHREANTLSSKSADAETTRASVDLKVLIEQMREQVQNVE